jgi:hypothetical protein
MSARGSADRRAIRVILALIAVSACLGAAAALARPGGGPGLEGRVTVTAPRESAKSPEGEARPPRPSFVESPEATSALGETQLRFHIPPRSGRPQPQPPVPSPAPSPAKPRRHFQCRFDGGEWHACRSPHRLGAVPPGAHAFAVRALTRSGVPGPVASYSWRQVDPKPISIAAEDFDEALFPGRPRSALVTVVNPNDVPVEVTRLTVALASDPPGCPVESFRLIPSSASSDSPLALPAGESVALPSGSISAPAIEMLNLPVNQDACLGAKLDLVFEAEGRG